MFAHFVACSEFVKTKIIIAVKNVENIMDINAEDLFTVVTGFQVRSEVLTVVNIKITVFWDVTSYSFIDRYKFSFETVVPVGK
jgi:hypothetical protein